MTEEGYAVLTAADLAHRWRDRSVLESVDEAIGQAGPAEEYATPDSALRWLLILAWADLQSARQRALNGRWSMECDGHVARIAGLTRLAGPAPWGEVDADLILDGVYERIHVAVGAPTPLSDDDQSQVRRDRNRC